MIILYDSPTLADKLKPYPEDYRFYLNKGFSISLRGGARGDTPDQGVSAALASTVMQSAAAGGYNPTQS